MIQAVPISAEAFAPYGHLARNGEGVTRSIRDGSVLLTKTPVQCGHDDKAVNYALDFYDVAPEPGRLLMTQAEQHPHSSQLFMPFSAKRYLVVVWPEKPALNVPPQAFIAGGTDIVIYNPGVWHHGIVALDRRTLFASAMWRTVDGKEDAVFLPLEAPIEVTWPERAA
jgi:ureidoglycolate lyase